MMAETLDHSWILEALSDLIAYAELHDQPRVVALLCVARGGLNHVLGKVEKQSWGAGNIEEQWFDIALDELARYCHLHGFTETEHHLVEALEVWVKEQDTKPTKGNVVPFNETDP